MATSEKQKAYNKKWYKNNKEKSKEICKKWRDNNKEKWRELDKIKHRIYDKKRCAYLREWTRLRHIDPTIFI
jgi:hypothetical protein